MLHLKRNHFLLLFWVVLFAFATQSFATKFGIPALFLTPEYQGVVGMRSFAILGFSLGAFIMAFNIYTYINHAHRFPFLGTLSRPFFKFCINNFILPLSFVITYMWCSAAFLKEVELKGSLDIFLDMLAFLLGNALFIILSTIYFFPTNKNIFKITGLTEEEMEQRLQKRRARNQRGAALYFNGADKSRWRVDTYMVNPFKVNLARESHHYDTETLRKVFFQNHVNASFFEAIMVLAFFFIGAFQYSNFFLIPAAASACLVFTVVLMGISIVTSWLKGWTLTVLLVVFMIFNWASGHWDILNQSNYAYGLDYKQKPHVPYNTAAIDSINNDLMRVNLDIEHHKNILEAKVAQLSDRSREEKPKLVIINSSGGGLRSSLWTVRGLQYADSLTRGKLMNSAVMMTGASGGVIGAAYYRELYLRNDSLEKPITDASFRENISTDILNRVLFTFATNDIFIRFRRTRVAGETYILDRGKTFENQLNRNTGFVLDKKVSDYYKPVSKGQIPMMIMAPSVVNDGRRMLISSQPISYLSYEFPDVSEQLNLSHENIEFARLFAGRGVKDLRMTSALRMNSTFPYVLPYASLPTDPKIEVMDAGLRDNFGMKITAQYLYAFREWLEENTSGIVILQLRDTQKSAPLRDENTSVLDRLTDPIGSFYGNYFNDQDYNMDQILQMVNSGFDVPIYQIPLEIRYPREEQIALSWHLTALEKKKINEAILRPHNQEALEKLRSLID